MKKNFARLFCLVLLTVAGVGGYSQSQSTPKPKSSTTPKTAPAAKSKAADEQSTASPIALPPLPEIDTTAAPDDELTKEIKKMISTSGSMNIAVETVKYMIDKQRSNPAQVLPAEFYDRFLQSVSNGRVARLLENAVVKVYREKFTLEEIKDINAFYASPTGKKLITELPNISTASRTAGEKIGSFIALQIATDMVKEGKLK